MRERKIYNNGNLITEKDFINIPVMWRYNMRCINCNNIISKLKKGKFQEFSPYCSVCGRKFTNLKKFGTTTPAESETIKEKMKKTCLEKYGCEYAMQFESFKEKRKNTCIKKFGVDNPNKNKKIRQKIENTNLTRYGVKYITQTKKFNDAKDKALKEYWNSDRYETCLKNFTKKALKDKDFKCLNAEVEWLDKDLWRGLVEKSENGYQVVYYTFKCKKCSNIFSDTFHGGKIPVCRKCHPMTHSNEENEIFNFIKSIYSGNIEQNNRKILNGKELDLYLPEFNLGIEYDGSYWHNNSHKSIKKYNLHKCEIFFIRDFEWIGKRNKIECLIKSKLNIFDKKIYARKCIIKEIDSNTYNNFCNKNHLQDTAQAKIKIGLYYNSELVQIESFRKSKFNKNYEWELIRECSKLGYQIIGGKEKILKYFERNYSPKSLLAYCDALKFNGSSYLRCGFSKKGLSSENYVYTDRKTVLNRYKCKKCNLSKILKEFNPELSETENMLKNGWYKIFDCGNIIFEKIY